MRIEETNLKGCFILHPNVFVDERGSFFETFNCKTFKSLTGLDVDFVQDNQSTSSKGVLRGLHFQKGTHSQAKLIRVVKGKVLDVFVDIRQGSPTFGQHLKVVLEDTQNKQVFIPRGFAHGFLALEDNTILSYKCDNYYNKASESGIIYNDGALGIDWEFPLNKLLLSNKDKELPTFQSILNEQ